MARTSLTSAVEEILCLGTKQLNFTQQQLPELKMWCDVSSKGGSSLWLFSQLLSLPITPRDQLTWSFYIITRNIKSPRLKTNLCGLPPPSLFFPQDPGWVNKEMTLSWHAYERDLVGYNQVIWVTLQLKVALSWWEMIFRYWLSLWGEKKPKQFIAKKLDVFKLCIYNVL